MKKFIVIFLLCCTSAFAQTYTVERVIDGDTIKLTNGETVILIGIDAPMAGDKEKAKRDLNRIGRMNPATIRKMGKEAAKFVDNLLGGSYKAPIILEYDTQKKDKHGRTLAYVYFMSCPRGAMCEPSPPWHSLVNKDDGAYIFLNATIIKAGYASALTIQPNVTYADLFQDLYQEARENKRGLWADDKEMTANLPNYKMLAQECHKKKSVSCCLASVEAMEEGQYMLDTGKTFQETTCPQGFKPNMMRCLDSYRWCIPDR